MTHSRCVFVLVLSAGACQREVEAPKKLAPPAQIRHAIAEDALTTLELTAAAIARLGIVTEPVARTAIPRVRQLAGQTVVPPGRTMLVQAPVAGRLMGTPPQPGAVVRAGAAMFTLSPLTSPDAQTTLAAAAAAARGAAGVAAARLAAATSALARAEQILGEGAGSARAVEEARAERDAATAALDAANAQQAAIADGGDKQQIAIVAPIDGTLTQVHALSGALVPAGAALFEIVDDAVLWVDVRVYVGDLPTLDLTAAAQVGAPGAGLAQLTRKVQPVQAPPAAQADAATASLFYVLDNHDHTLRPGERLTVAVPKPGATEDMSSTPASAIVFDLHGGTWVYVQTTATTFTRRRVEVRAVAGERAILVRGPAPGTPLVTTGAAELFGTEFFEGK